MRSDPLTMHPWAYATHAARHSWARSRQQCLILQQLSGCRRRKIDRHLLTGCMAVTGCTNLCEVQLHQARWQGTRYLCHSVVFVSRLFGHGGSHGLSEHLADVPSIGRRFFDEAMYRLSTSTHTHSLQPDGYPHPKNTVSRAAKIKRQSTR